MRIPPDLKTRIIDNVKDGAVEVINDKLRETIQDGRAFEQWSKEDQERFSLIREVEGQILRRVRRTLGVE